MGLTLSHLQVAFVTGNLKLRLNVTNNSSGQQVSLLEPALLS